MNKTGRPSIGKPKLLLMALLQGATLQEASAKVGVHWNTAAEWTRQPRFQAALEAYGNRLLELGVTRLATRLDKAIDNLDDLMDNGEHKDRLAAVQTVLDRLVKLAEHVHPKPEGGTVNVQVNLGLANRLRQLDLDAQHSGGQSVPVLAQPDRPPVGATPVEGT